MHKSLAKEIANYTNIYVVGNFSMYDKNLNQYKLLSDGNFNLWINRLFIATKKYQADFKVTIQIPENTAETTFDLIQYIDNLFGYNQLNIRFIRSDEYSTSAYKNRLATRNKPILCDNYDLIVTEFHQTKIIDSKTLKLSDVDVIYSWNISRVSNLHRQYIDEFFYEQLAIAHSGKQVYVLNESQVKEFSYHTATKSVYVDSDVFSAELCKIKFEHHRNAELVESIYEQIQVRQSLKTLQLLFPYRLTDKAYQFDKLISAINDKLSEHQLMIVYVTNPSNCDVYQFLVDTENIIIVDLSKMYSEYTAIERYVASIYATNYANLSIPCFESPSDVLHQALFELNVMSETIQFDNEPINYVHNLFSNSVTKSASKYLELRTA